MPKKIDMEIIRAFASAAIRGIKDQTKTPVEVGQPSFRGENYPISVDVAGIIEISSPQFVGTFVLAFPRDCFLELIKRMTGESHKIIDSKVRDGASEFLNIIYGEVKSVLNEKNYAFPMAIPEVQLADMAVEKMLKADSAVIIPFKTPVGNFFVQVGLKSEETREENKNFPIGPHNPNSFPADIRILIVDDMGVMRKNVRRSLNELGYAHIYEANNGLVGLRAIEKSLRDEKPYDLVLSDWNMPEMMGIELLKKVRAMPKMKKTPFLLLTAESEAQQVVQGILDGADAYILKPFTTEILNEKLAETFHKKKDKKSA